MKPYLFFLSHVRGADEEWVAMFFRDLCDAVAERTGRSPATVGLRGDPASREAPLDLMRKASALVALRTPQYDTRNYCAAEWEFFRQRAEVLWSRTGRSADAIIPVTWVPPAPGEDPLPSWPKPLTVSAEAYRRDGLLRLLRLGVRFRPVYQEVVQALATRLALPKDDLPDLPGFTFTGAVGRTRRPAAPAGAAVSVVVASTSSAELPEERHSREYYGPSPLDWSPYSPERPRSLVSLIEETAADLEFLSEVLPLDAPAAQGLADAAEDPERFVVLLVDAWAATLRRQQQLLAGLDARPPGSTAVLEPRSSEDTESVTQAQVLDEALDQALPQLRQAGTADQLRRWGLPDAEQFTAALRRALVSAQNDALKTTAEHEAPDVPTGRFATFPQLGRFSS